MKANTARITNKGKSQIVCFPRGFKISGKEVYIKNNDNGIVSVIPLRQNSSEIKSKTPTPSPNKT